MEGFKKINFAALCQLNCKRFRPEVEDKSGKKLKLSKQVRVQIVLEKESI